MFTAPLRFNCQTDDFFFLINMIITIVTAVANTIEPAMIPISTPIGIPSFLPSPGFSVISVVFSAEGVTSFTGVSVGALVLTLLFSVAATVGATVFTEVEVTGAAVAVGGNVTFSVAEEFGFVEQNSVYCPVLCCRNKSGLFLMYCCSSSDANFRQQCICF